MKLTQFNYCMLHSLVGKNDGVSIVIDQCVNAMLNDMSIPLGNLFFLAAHISPRFNAQTDEIFWHKNDIHKTIIRNYSNTHRLDALDTLIERHARRAQERIAAYVKQHDVDVIIAHNTSHPYNLITAVGLAYFIQDMRAHGEKWPKVIVWWHDSHLEREIFRNPNEVIKKYLAYLPGTYIDGLVCINSEQPALARAYFEEYGMAHIDDFLAKKTVVIPNTSDIAWPWHDCDWNTDALIHPPQDAYNAAFFFDTLIDSALQENGFTLNDAVFLLQHTRIVPRKCIETAIDYAFRIAQKFQDDAQKKCIVLFVSGHSGDEQAPYKKQLQDYFTKKKRENEKLPVLLLFGEEHIFSHRDIIVDKRYYKFSEVPCIIAARGGIGTYFSEVEGYGNNLLEMLRSGLPVVINEYPVYQKDIAPLGFSFPSITHNELTDDIVEQGYRLLTDMKARNAHLAHNLAILEEQLPHEVITHLLKPLIEKVLRT